MALPRALTFCSWPFDVVLTEHAPFGPFLVSTMWYEPCHFSGMTGGFLSGRADPHAVLTILFSRSVPLCGGNPPPYAPRSHFFLSIPGQETARTSYVRVAFPYVHPRFAPDRCNFEGVRDSVHLLPPPLRTFTSDSLFQSSPTTVTDCLERWVYAEVFPPSFTHPPLTPTGIVFFFESAPTRSSLSVPQYTVFFFWWRDIPGFSLTPIGQP